MKPGKKKVIIVGGSISGLAAACLLSKKMDVSVIEQKPKNKIGGKVCANVVTSAFLDLTRKLGINQRGITLKKFSLAKFYSESNYVDMPIEDYEINRKKFVELLIEKAERAGVKFHFKTRFTGLQKISKRYEVVFENNSKKTIETADFVIGADGALSEVARKAGLWGIRKFWLAMQAKVSKLERKISPGSYEIFFIKKFGYYGYIFPSRSGRYIVGVVASPQDAKKNFSQFRKFLKIKRRKADAALIPLPKAIKTQKGNIFLAGDAACQVKFTGGGIIPAIESAFSLHDLILHRNRRKSGKLKREILLQELVTKVLSKLNAKDFGMLFETAKKTETDAAKSRDKLSKWAVRVVLRNPQLLKFLPKIL